MLKRGLGLSEAACVMSYWGIFSKYAEKASEQMAQARVTAALGSIMLTQEPFAKCLEQFPFW